MTDKPDGFRATYANWKCIPSRGIVQIVLEIAMERPISDHAYQVLGGMPNPGADTWVAVVRLNPSGVVVAPSTPAPAPELPPTPPARATNRLVTRAAILCDDPMFQLWLRKENDRPEVVDKDTAAVAMRHLLGIVSRREIIPGSEVEKIYNVMVAKFDAWAHPDILDETAEVASIP